VILLLLLLGVTPVRADTDWLPDHYSQGAATTAPAAPWWDSFGDPGLSDAVSTGLAANPDIGALDALARSQRALAGQSLSAVLPGLSFDVQGQLAPTDTRVFGFGLDVPSAGDAPATYSTGSAKFNASLAVDLWGRGLTSWRASRLDALAAEGDRDATALVLSTTIGAAWFDIGAARQQLAVLQRQRQLVVDLLEVVRLRYDGGSASALDVLQQEQSLAAVDTQLPLMRAQLRLARQRLAVLLGADPSGALPEGPDAMPSLPADPAVGSPADLLDQRPDVHAAAVRVDAAGARRSAALRNLLPTLALSGSWGWQYYYETEWDTVQSWSAGAALSVPLFGGGSRQAGLKQAGAARTAAELQLESTLRSAVQEVEAGLTSQAEQRARAEAAANQLQRAEQAWQLAADQYARGLADYLQVSSALSTLLSAELTDIQAQRDLLGARLQLHQALGGTWTSDLDSLSADAG